MSLFTDLTDKLRFKFNDWFVSFIIHNEFALMESEMKSEKKKKTKELEIPQKVKYPSVNIINEGVYYKLINHPGRANIKVFVSSFDIWPLVSNLTTSSFDTPTETERKMKDVILLLNKIDSYNNLKPVSYYWVNCGDEVDINYNTIEKGK